MTWELSEKEIAAWAVASIRQAKELKLDRALWAVNPPPPRTP